MTLCAGGLAVGAVVLDRDGVIVAEGRNRAYDPPTGTDPLEGTPVAHAEMNALARLATTTDTAALTIWSSQQPCAMCAAALSFIGITDVNVIATDPSDPDRRAAEVLDDVWVVLATAMFLVGPLGRGGRAHPMVQRNLVLEPESVALAERTRTDLGALVDGRALEDALAVVWSDVQDAARERRRRLASTPEPG